MGGHHTMGRSYSQDLRDRVVAFVAEGRSRAGGGGAVPGQRTQCGAVVSALAGDGQLGSAEDGRPTPALAGGEREWLLARVTEKPDLTLRAIVAEQWHELPRLCRTVPVPDAGPRRHRHHGQSWQPQRPSGAAPDPQRRRQAALPAAI